MEQGLGLPLAHTVLEWLGVTDKERLPLVHTEIECVAQAVVEGEGLDVPEAVTHVDVV